MLSLAHDGRRLTPASHLASVAGPNAAQVSAAAAALTGRVTTEASTRIIERAGRAILDDLVVAPPVVLLETPEEPGPRAHLQVTLELPPSVQTLHWAHGPRYKGRCCWSFRGKGAQPHEAGGWRSAFASAIALTTYPLPHGLPPNMRKRPVLVSGSIATEWGWHTNTGEKRLTSTDRRWHAPARKCVWGGANGWGDDDQPRFVSLAATRQAMESEAAAASAAAPPPPQPPRAGESSPTSEEAEAMSAAAEESLESITADTAGSGGARGPEAEEPPMPTTLPGGEEAPKGVGAGLPRDAHDPVESAPPHAPANEASMPTTLPGGEQSQGSADASLPQGTLDPGESGPPRAPAGERATSAPAVGGTRGPGRRDARHPRPGADAERSHPSPPPGPSDGAPPDSGGGHAGCGRGDDASTLAERPTAGEPPAAGTYHGGAAGGAAARPPTPEGAGPADTTAARSSPRSAGALPPGGVGNGIAGSSGARDPEAEEPPMPATPPGGEEAPGSAGAGLLRDARDPVEPAPLQAPADVTSMPTTLPGGERAQGSVDASLPRGTLDPGEAGPPRAPAGERATTPELGGPEPEGPPSPAAGTGDTGSDLWPTLEDLRGMTVAQLKQEARISSTSLTGYLEKKDIEEVLAARDQTRERRDCPQRPAVAPAPSPPPPEGQRGAKATGTTPAALSRELVTRVMRLATAATQSADPADWPRAGDVLGGRVWGLEKGGRVSITTDRCLVLLGERPDSSDGQLKRVGHAQPAPDSDDKEKARFMAARTYTVELLKEVRRNAAVRLAARTAGLLTACRALLKAEKEAERVGEVGLHMDLLFTHGPVDWRDRLPTFDEADVARAALLATLGVTFERPHDPEACHEQVDRAVQAIARLHGKVYGHLVEHERIQLADLLEHAITEADVYWCPRRWLSGAGPSTATLKPWLAFFTPESEMPSAGEDELRNMCEAALERILREQACNVPKEDQASTAREWQPPPDTEACTLQRWQALLACAGRETAVRAVVEALRERRDATWQEHRDLWKSGTGPNCMDLEDPSGRGSSARYLQAMLRDALNASISGAVAHLIDAKGAAEGSISKRLRERAARTADIARDCREAKGPASRHYAAPAPPTKR